MYEDLRERRQFVLYRLVPCDDGRTDKVPVDPATGRNSNAQDEATWMLPAEAAAHAARYGAGHGVGLAMREPCGLFCIDVDHCRNPDGSVSEIARKLVADFAGCYVEWSQSGNGLHIFGSYAGDAPPHECKNSALHIECYTERRFIALTGNTYADGSPRHDATLALWVTVASYFTPRAARKSDDLTDAPVWPEVGIETVKRNKPRFARLLAGEQLLADASNQDLEFVCYALEAHGGDGQATLQYLQGPHGYEFSPKKADRLDYYLPRTILEAFDRLKDDPTVNVRFDGAVPAVASVPANTSMPTPLGIMHYGIIRTNLRYDPIADEENVRLLLENEPNLQGIVRFDEFAGELLLVRPITSDAGLVSERGIPRPWTDADTATLQTFIQKHYIPKIAREKIDSIVSMHARQRCAFHPVRDYLQSLAWDGTPRLNDWLGKYMTRDSKQSPEYLAAVGAAWFISAVARIYEPGCQADCALVFEGDQGTRKSTALRILAGDDHFSDSLPADLTHKDARDHLRGKWIIELPELAQFRRNEIETVKAFLSRRHEQYRPSYGRHEIRFPRQCVFAGSTNESTYLVDTTGNRRFWVVGSTHVNLTAIRRDRDQLWAEAVTRYRAGEPWYLAGALEAMAAAEAAERVAHDPWTAQVADVVAQRVTGADASPGEIMAHMNLPTTERHARNATRVGTILTDLKWKRGKRHMTRGQLYARPVPPPPNIANRAPK